jgi:hypothetical protein
MVFAKTGVLQAGSHDLAHLRVGSEAPFKMQYVEEIAHNITLLDLPLIGQQCTEVLQAETDAGQSAEELLSIFQIKHEQAVDGALEKLQRVAAGFGQLIDDPRSLRDACQRNGLFA